MDTRQQLALPKSRHRKRVRRKKIKWYWLFLFLLAILSFGTYQVALNFLKPYSATSTIIQVEIPRGITPKGIGQILVDNKLIHHAEAFYLYTRWHGIDQNLKAGTYTLDASWPLEKIAFTLTKGGQAASVSFTIPEGFNLQQIAHRLAEIGLVDEEEFLQVAASDQFDYDFLDGIPVGKKKLEGFLFPDTYQVKEDATAEEIINVMLKRFNQIYGPEFLERERDLGLTTLEVITMASIVEREAKLDKERPVVAGVFFNRLEQKWRLESCATVQYLLDEPKEVLLLRDLEIESPYNTYKYAGLPPGPIASPGKASIEAVLYPANVDYMFFAAKGDGTHIFSRTLKEHNRAVAQISGQNQ